MSLTAVFLIAFSMAMDAFAVSLCSGLKIGPGPRPVFLHRFSFRFVPGADAGHRLAVWQDHRADRKNLDHWVAFGLLAFVGIRMIRSGLSKREEEIVKDPSRGWTMVMLSVAVSIDALAIGLSLAFLGRGHLDAGDGHRPGDRGLILDRSAGGEWGREQISESPSKCSAGWS
jgi:manganese efflux pump family protein